MYVCIYIYTYIYISQLSWLLIPSGNQTWLAGKFSNSFTGISHGQPRSMTRSNGSMSIVTIKTSINLIIIALESHKTTKFCKKYDIPILMVVHKPYHSPKNLLRISSPHEPGWHLCCSVARWRFPRSLPSSFSELLKMWMWVKMEDLGDHRC